MLLRYSLRQIPNRLPFAPILYLVERLTSCFRSAFCLTRSDVRVCSHLVPCLSHFSVVFASLHIVGTKPFTAPRPLFDHPRSRSSSHFRLGPRSYSVYIEIAKAIASQFGKSIEAMGGVFQPCDSSCPGRDGKAVEGLQQRMRRLGAYSALRDGVDANFGRNLVGRGASWELMD